MRKRARCSTFIVSGFGEFPFDMLRYDGAYPASEQDAGKLSNYCQAMRENRQTERFAIELRTCHDTAPTERRWESFLWKVTHIDGERRT
jgi:hypothetical protein